ncbi:hypothetical protein PAXRUDRAFT_162400, partial [Paxillus rubicundulus Ve08.2h10]
WILQTMPNTYNVCWKEPFLALPGAKTIVIFISADVEALPMTSPEYLEIRAACARVANLSGVGDYIDKAFRDLDLCLWWIY